MDWKSNQQEIFWREYWQGHWLSCDAASINAYLRVWVRMLLVPWSLVIVVQFHMIRPDNCVLIISMFTALHKIMFPNKIHMWACQDRREPQNMYITWPQVRLRDNDLQLQCVYQRINTVLSYFQHTAQISALMTKTVKIKHTCDNNRADLHILLPVFCF